MEGEQFDASVAERLRLIIDGTNDYAIFMLSPTGHIETWNSGAQRIKGYTADETIGRHFSMFYTPHDLEISHPEQGHPRPDGTQGGRGRAAPG